MRLKYVYRIKYSKHPIGRLLAAVTAVQDLCEVLSKLPRASAVRRQPLPGGAGPQSREAGQDPVEPGELPDQGPIATRGDHIGIPIPCEVLIIEISVRITEADTRDNVHRQRDESMRQAYHASLLL